MKIIVLFFMILLFLLPAFAGDICTKLNTNDGSSAFKIQDKDSKLLFSVDSSGKVGIGTGSPQSILQVSGPSTEVFSATNLSSAFLALTNTNTTTNNFSRLLFNTIDNSGVLATGAGLSAIFTSHTTNAVSADLAIQTKNAGTVAEIARFTAAGSLGIGISNPGAKLQISAGDSSLALFGPNATWGGKLYVGAATDQGRVASTAQIISSNGNLHLDSAPSCNLYLNYFQPTNTYLNYNGGNVAIGAVNPVYKLHVAGDIYANGGWLRTSGATGWFNETYAGGWYMTDATWIRAYNGKYVWVDQVLGCNTGLTVGYGGAAPGSWGGAIFAGPVAIGTSNNSTGYALYVNGYVYSYGYYSDVRFKKNITPLSDSLEKISKLQGINFEWKKDKVPNKMFESGKRVGLIAQEVEKIIPEVVTTDNEGFKGIYYEKIVPYLIEAIKEQQKAIDSLETELKRRNDALEKLAIK
ncbi:MAG: tail fiber domain-containing protein [Candidatus Wallbacteria bacterium]|nr:tail fiber domain-containing protein [Candidatus Wallbacteria bacterium]